MALLFSIHYLLAGEYPVTKRVLMVFSEGKDLPVNVRVERAVKAELEHKSTNRIEFYAEHLDASRFPGESHYKLFREYLREKYRQRPPDLIMAFLGRSFSIAGELPAEIFPDVPIVFASVNELEIPREIHEAQTAGIVQRHDFESTFNAILQLQPNTRRITVIGGMAAIDRSLIKRAQEVASGFAPRVQFEFWTNQPMAQLREMVAKLQPGNVICLSTMFRDAAGESFFPEQVAEILTASANAPIYVLAETLLGTGAVGGALIDFDELGKESGKLTMHILNGISPSDLPIGVRSHNALIFDWRALKRWGISENRLPAGSVIRFKPPSLWQDHKNLIIWTAGILIAQMLTIAGLLVHRARRRRSENALRESEQRMILAADAAKLGMWVWDIRRDAVWISAEGRRLFGWSDSEKVTFEKFFSSLHPEDREPTRRTVQRALASAGTYEVEYRTVRTDGIPRWVAVRGQVEFDGKDGEKEAARVRGVSMDISARKHAESEAQRQRAELAHVARVSTVGELAASVAHELNQPLGAILSNAEAAELFLNQSPPALSEVRDILTDIRKDDERAGEVIRRMRSLLKKRELEQQTLDFNSVVEDVFQLVSSDATLRKTEIVADLSPKLPKVRGDRVHLQQVLLNLMINAMEAMAKVPPEKRRLNVRTSLDSNQKVMLAVRDSGSGIESDVLPRLFDPFFTTKANGMGMGLSIARRIIEAHHGRIWAENNESGGATFRVALPAGSEAG